MSQRVETWKLRTQFATALSRLYSAEVPAYTTVVYEDFLPASAAGIFRSNLDTDAQAGDADDASGYSLDWMAGAIGHNIHDPYALYEKAAI